MNIGKALVLILAIPIAIIIYKYLKKYEDRNPFQKKTSTDLLNEVVRDQEEIYKAHQESIAGENKDEPESEDLPSSTN